MSQLFKAAAAPAELGWVGGSITLLFLVVLSAWAVWVYLPGQRSLMEEASRMPLDDGGEG